VTLAQPSEAPFMAQHKLCKLQNLPGYYKKNCHLLGYKRHS